MSLADLDGATRLAAIATAENPTSKDWFKVGGPAAVPAVHPGPLQSVIRCLPLLCRSCQATTSLASAPSAFLERWTLGIS